MNESYNIITTKIECINDELDFLKGLKDLVNKKSNKKEVNFPKENQAIMVEITGMIEDVIKDLESVRSLKPFDELTKEVQDLDEKYKQIVIKVSKKLNLIN